MSSITATNTAELSVIQEDVDSSKITINTNNSKLIIENNSSDVTISKFEASSTISNVPTTSNSSITMKTQVLPLVYIQNSSKVPFASTNKTNSNVIVNNLPQIQFATIGSNVNKNNASLTTSSIPVPSNQNLIFATSGSQPLLIKKQQGNVVPIVPVSGSKISGTYLTMVKSVSVSSDTSTVNKMQISTGAAPKVRDISFINNNTYLQSQNQSPKIVLAPMPKITSSRLPATATTNSPNSFQPKIAILPMPVPINEPNITKQKTYNFKIHDGRNQNDATPTVTVMCNTLMNTSYSNENSTDADSNSENLVCDDVIDLEIDTSEKDMKNKTYELSITEESEFSQSDHKVNRNLGNSFSLPKYDVSPFTHRESPKYPKHGVSILKKNYSNFSDRLEKKNLLVCSVPNSNIVSEVQPANKNASSKEEVVITIPSSPSQKPEKERRRKSNFAYRKEFDDMEITSDYSSANTTITVDLGKKPRENSVVKESKKCSTNEVEIKVINKNQDINMNDDCDLQKILSWNEVGIGSLPGSKCKFILNEFNMIEYVTEDECKKITDKKFTKTNEKVKIETQEEMRCLECGCYGLPTEFINPRFCSYDCQESLKIKAKKEKHDHYKKKKKKSKKELNAETKLDLDRDSGSEDDSIDNLSQDKFLSYPWACKKKGFSWSKYLEHIKAKPAPVKLFKDPFPYTRNGFRPGMKLEGVDPQHPSYFCVLTVAEVMGYRLRLHFDGYPDNYDFWCNADSMDIFPIGWCEKYGHVLQPPPGYTVDNFNWVQYLKTTKTTAAPKHLFANRAGQAICPNGFRVGMKLEAVDRKNTSLVCVASVRDMMDNRILVHFDSWDDIYDYWADPTSPYIHPVGWCDQYGHNLTPPNDKSKMKITDVSQCKDYPNPESFSWEVYLKETKAVAAPVRAFKQRPTCGFKRGMRLECVDKRVPQLIRVATVDDVKEHQIRIHFDGWLDRYSYWVDDDSPDIHPVGWCQKTGHAIEPPLTPDDVYDFQECRTVGCRGQGHIRGSKYPNHSSQKYCPYDPENINAEKLLPDRLLSPDRNPEAVVPVSREPKECKIKPRLGRPPKYPRLEPPKPEPEYEPPEKKLQKKCPLKKPVKLQKLSSVERKVRMLIEQSNILPAERESWYRHAQFLKNYTDRSVDPISWSNRDVIDFISNFPGCECNAKIFKDEKIDGEAFLSLNQKDILSKLKMKVGPAVKLYNSIVLLRQHKDVKVFSAQQK